MYDDWEKEDFVIPVLNVQNEEQLKRLEERKLVEESDNALTKELFSNNKENLVVKQIQIINKNIDKKILKKNFLSKQKENEEKQKQLSKKLKEEKLKKLKEIYTFGEAEEDNEYAKYENIFY
jgi:hypothetical protein